MKSTVNGQRIDTESTENTENGFTDLTKNTKVRRRNDDVLQLSRVNPGDLAMEA
jgi:hypothetical protein